MNVKETAIAIHANAKAKGFYEPQFNYAEKIMLVVCELSESIEADRVGKSADVTAFDNRYSELVNSMNPNVIKPENEDNVKREYFTACFKKYIKDSKEDEIADAIIRLLDLVGYMGIDIEKHIELKMKYNSSREYLHGKKY